MAAWYLFASLVCLGSQATRPSTAAVLRYLPERKLLGISAGTSDGFREGVELALWRSGKRIGRLKVIKANPIVAWCRIVSLAPGVTPRAGDEVTRADHKPKEKPKEPAPPPKPVPPLAPRAEELLAVGAGPHEIVVSSTEGVYVLRGASCRRDESLLPHQILRFVPWGDRLWAETDGGVFLREGLRWEPFRWSHRFGQDRPAFARVATYGTQAWGVYGRYLLLWDERAQRIVITGRKKDRKQGDWVRVGRPFPSELQAILPLNERQLLLGTRDRKLYVKDGHRLAELETLHFCRGDPVLLELARDKAGTTWGLFFGDGGGLFSLSTRGLSLVPRASGKDRPPEALPPGPLLRLCTGQDKQLFVLHHTEGVFRLRESKWERYGPRPAEPAADMALSGGSVLLLTERKLLRIEPDRTVEVYSFPQAGSVVERSPLR